MRWCASLTFHLYYTRANNVDYCAAGTGLDDVLDELHGRHIPTSAVGPVLIVFLQDLKLGHLDQNAEFIRHNSL